MKQYDSNETTISSFTENEEEEKFERLTVKEKTIDFNSFNCLKLNEPLEEQIDFEQKLDYYYWPYKLYPNQILVQIKKPNDRYFHSAMKFILLRKTQCKRIESVLQLLNYLGHHSDNYITALSCAAFCNNFGVGRNTYYRGKEGLEKLKILKPLNTYVKNLDGMSAPLYILDLQQFGEQYTSSLEN